MKRLIALCGAPGAGKTEVQNYLRDTYGVTPVDDGHPLRDFAMRHLGLSKWHVSTQEGKASMVFLPGGKTMTVREALGELGNKIEDLFGPDAIPEMALMQACEPRAYSFGSVRREQGRVYKERGAVIVEIRRPGCEIVNEFDRYDPQYASILIHNNDTLERLHHRVNFLLGPHLRTSFEHP